MDFSFPSFHFNRDLHEVPDSYDEFQIYIENIIKKLMDLPVEKQRDLFTHLGVAYRILKQLERAEEFLARALDLCGDNEEIIFTAKIRLAHCFQWQKRFELSNAMFKELQTELSHKIKNFKLISFFWQHKGKNEFDQGHFTKALSCFEKSLRIRTEQEFSQDLIESAQIAVSEAKNRLLDFRSRLCK